MEDLQKDDNYSWTLSSLIMTDGVYMAVGAKELGENPFPITNDVPIE